MDKITISDSIHKCMVLVKGLKGGLNIASDCEVGLLKEERYGLCEIGTLALENIEAELDKMKEALDLEED